MNNLISILLLMVKGIYQLGKGSFALAAAAALHFGFGSFWESVNSDYFMSYKEELSYLTGCLNPFLLGYHNPQLIPTHSYGSAYCS